MPKTRRDVAAYSGGNGMLTGIWGPPLWHTLHTISFNYPVAPCVSTKNDYRQFVLSLRHVLPCGKCRDNLSKNLEAVPLTDTDLESRDAFSRWMHRFHDHVNVMLGKPRGPGYEEIRERYEAFRAKCSSSKKTKSKRSKKEKGCTRAMRGRKSKCVMRIVPYDDACVTFKVDSRCRHPKTRRKS
jgi:hypothetical protein